MSPQNQHVPRKQLSKGLDNLMAWSLEPRDVQEFKKWVENCHTSTRHKLFSSSLFLFFCGDLRCGIIDLKAILDTDREIGHFARRERKVKKCELTEGDRDKVPFLPGLASDYVVWISMSCCSLLNVSLPERPKKSIWMLLSANKLKEVFRVSSTILVLRVIWPRVGEFN